MKGTNVRGGEGGSGMEKTAGVREKGEKKVKTMAGRMLRRGWGGAQLFSNKRVRTDLVRDPWFTFVQCFSRLFKTQIPEVRKCPDGDTEQDVSSWGNISVQRSGELQSLREHLTSRNLKVPTPELRRVSE